MRFKALTIIPHNGEFEIKPLVLCKDCRHYYCGCTKGHDCPNSDWYCADGEKKREGTRRYRCSLFGTITREEDDDEDD